MIDRNLLVEFGNKNEIYELIYSLEEERNILVYGKADEKQIKKVIEIFNKLKNIFYKLFENEGFKI